jgi:hypothetical protein
VIILDIVEDVPLRKLYQKSKLSSSRVAQLLKDFGNPQGKAAHQTKDDQGDERESDAESYTISSKTRWSRQIGSVP